MATKKSKVKVNDKQFPRMEFYVDQLPGCCGIGVIANIREIEGGWDYRLNRPRPSTKVYTTKKEQAKALYQEILERTSSGGYGGDFYSQLLISLVSSYDRQYKPEKAGEHQYQELQDLLLKEGWTIYSVFINPNHGNEVTLFGKYFSDRTVHPDDAEEEEGVAWDDDEF